MRVTYYKTAHRVGVVFGDTEHMITPEQAYGLSLGLRIAVDQIGNVDSVTVVPAEDMETNEGDPR